MSTAPVKSQSCETATLTGGGGGHLYLYRYIYLLKSGCPVSDRFAYSAPSTAAVSLGVASPHKARSAESKQGQDDTERSDVSACHVDIAMLKFY